MARTRRVRQSKVIINVTNTDSSSTVNVDEDQNHVENSNEDNNDNDENQNPDGHDNQQIKLKSNVWMYAKKISAERAQCIKCKAIIKTLHGGTTTLRKHLIMKHKLTHLSLPTTSRANKNENSISGEQKARLDYLANVATYEDGRPFTDFRKSGIRKFLAEAIPGNIFLLKVINNNQCL
jgi:hypothetical protein